MSKEHDWATARKMIEANVRIWPYWREDGEKGLLLQRVNSDGSPGITIGSCKLVHANEYIGLMMRALEVGALIANEE